MKNYVEDNERFLDENRDLNIEKLMVGYKNFKEEKERLIKICEDMKLEYDYMINKHKESLENELKRITSIIASQIQRDEMKSTKTQFSYTVPSGSFIIKKPQDKLVLKADLVLKAVDIDKIPEEYIKTKKSINWAKYKELFEIVDNEVVNKKTGEIEETGNVIIERIPHSEGIKLK